MDTKQALTTARSALYGIAKTYDDAELRQRAHEAYELTGAALPSDAAQAPLPAWGMTRSGAVRSDEDAKKMAMRHFGLKGVDAASFDFGSGFNFGLAFGRATAPVAPAAAPATPTREVLLYQHDDESYAVAVTAEDAIFARGVPAWHRMFPVPIYGLDGAPAPAAAAPINLEGLRKKLLTPRKILRDDQGFLTHPDYPICGEGTRADKFLEAFGIETRFRSMENDLPDLHERWCDEGLDDCSEWTPTPPEGDGWLLLEIYDTEDGPYALFGRDKYEAENALKRARTRELSERIQQRQAPQGGNDA